MQRVPRAVFGGGRVQPDDVFQLRWRAAMIEDEPQGQAPRRVVIFADTHGTGDALAKALRGLGAAVAVVRPGPNFTQTGDEFVVNVKDPAQIAKLLAAAPGA